MKIETMYDPVASGLVKSRRGRQTADRPEVKKFFGQLQETGRLYFTDLSGAEDIKTAVRLAGYLSALAKANGARVSKTTWPDAQGHVRAIELALVTVG